MIINLQTNVTKITVGETVLFTAVLTDPDGLDDIVGGTLSDQTGMIGYGPFMAAGQPGTCSISLAWEAMHQAESLVAVLRVSGRVTPPTHRDRRARDSRLPSAERCCGRRQQRGRPRKARASTDRVRAKGCARGPRARHLRAPSVATLGGG